jgi:hypothetical protein
MVHDDLCGPIASATSRGNKYFLLLMDDLGMYMWVAMVPSKDHAIDAIKEIQAWVEDESGLKLRVLHADHGCEFTTREFTEYSTTEGVHHQHTVPIARSKTALSGARMAQWWQPPRGCSRPRVFPDDSGAKR